MISLTAGAALPCRFNSLSLANASNSSSGNARRQAPASKAQPWVISSGASTGYQPASLGQSARMSFTRSAVANSNSPAATSEDDDVVIQFPETRLLVPYPDHDVDIRVSINQTADDVSSELAQEIARISAESIAKRGVFSIVLSGGSLVKALTTLISPSFSSSIDWSRWHVFWADERVVKLDNRDSNFKAAYEEVLSHVPIPDDQIFVIDDELPAAECAAEYEQLIRELVEDSILTTTKGEVFPRFDLVLLGIGPDGHVASLFPNSPLLRETHRWVVPITNSPKPPPRRITLTLPVINAAGNVTIVVTGEGKAATVQNILERPALPGSLPAQLVRPYKGVLTWILDASAASKLQPDVWGDPKQFPSLDFGKKK